MRYSKIAMLILSALCAASAQFPPHGINALKNTQNKVKNMFQKFQTSGRRLQAFMSEECGAACDGAKDVQKAITANMEEIGKGDWSSLCSMQKEVKCMEDAEACQDPPDPNEPEEEDDEEGLECMCACPPPKQEMEGKDFCTGSTPKASNPYSCAVTNAAVCPKSSKEILNGWSKGDFDSAMNLHCKRMGKGCEEKGEDVMKCAGDDLTAWMTEGCDEAAGKGTLTSKAATCCPKGKTIIDCYDAECVKMSMQSQQLELKKNHDKETKDHLQKEQTKNFAIGTACPDTGMATSAADLDDPAAAASSSAWALLPSAITLATMVGGLLA